MAMSRERVFDVESMTRGSIASGSIQMPPSGHNGIDLASDPPIQHAVDIISTGNSTVKA